MSQALQKTTLERFHPRVEANLSVQFEWAGSAYSAKARDLSMAGLFILGYRLSPGRQFRLAIPLPEDREVFVTALVTRHTSEGMAVKFESVDWDDMIALARFLHPRLP